jgi:hypothetical protein
MTYIANPQHRDANFAGKKSQWIIPVSAEISCYNNSVLSGWLSNSSYWSVYAPTNCPTKLGISPCQQDLYIAKFVEDQAKWHGYPVAHWLSPYDKPAENVLNQWVAAGYINSAKKSKIHRGKKCAL